MNQVCYATTPGIPSRLFRALVFLVLGVALVTVQSISQEERTVRLFLNILVHQFFISDGQLLA